MENKKETELTEEQKQGLADGTYIKNNATGEIIKVADLPRQTENMELTREEFSMKDLHAGIEVEFKSAIYSAEQLRNFALGSFDWILKKRANKDPPSYLG